MVTEHFLKRCIEALVAEKRHATLMGNQVLPDTDKAVTVALQIVVKG